MEGRPESFPTRLSPWAPALALVALYAGLAWLVGYESDDGYIVYRYARNALAGHGFVYNPGEAVQGYTSPLWLLLLTGAGAALGPEVLPSAARVLGLVAGGAGVLLLHGFAGEVMGERGARRLLAPALLAVHASWLAWGTGGLETTLYGTLLFAAGFVYVRTLDGRGPLWPAPLLFGLAAITRAEAALPFAVTVLHLARRELRAGRAPWGGRVLGLAALFLVPVAPWVLAATAWYGSPVPNTALVKLDPGLGALRLGGRYLKDYVVRYGVPVVLAPALLLLRPSRLRPWQGYVGLVVGVELAWTVWVGGDGLAFHRFVAHVAPWMLALVAAGLLVGWDTLRASLPGPTRRAAAALAALFLATALWTTAAEVLRPLVDPEGARWREEHSGLVFPGAGSVHDYVWFDVYFVERQARAARWLEVHAPPGSLVAATPAGSIAFHTRHDVIDMLGLNDAHIARAPSGSVGFLRPGHMKGDGAYVLARRPTHVLLGNVAVLPFPIEDDATMQAKLVRKSEHELWALPAFHEAYERVVVLLEDSGPFRYFTFYRRRDLAADPDAPNDAASDAAKKPRAASAGSPTRASGGSPPSHASGRSSR